MSISRPPRKLVIAFDCDDVLIPTSFKLLDEYYKEYGLRVDPRYLYEKHDSWGVSDENAIARVLGLHKRGAVINVAPFPESVLAVNELLSAGHTLHVITGRHRFQAQDTINQLEKYFPRVFKSVEFTSYFGVSSRDKSEVCSELGVDVFIDDHAVHCNNVSRSGVMTIIYGNYPWNGDGVQVDTAVVRCLTMPDVVREVERVSKS